MAENRGGGSGGRSEEGIIITITRLVSFTPSRSRCRQQRRPSAASSSLLSLVLLLLPTATSFLVLKSTKSAATALGRYYYQLFSATQRRGGKRLRSIDTATSKIARTTTTSSSSSPMFAAADEDSLPSSSTATCSSSAYFIGFDLGTSGARMSVVDQSRREVCARAVSWDDVVASVADEGGNNAPSDKNSRYDDPDAWVSAVSTLLHGAVTEESQAFDKNNVKSICFSGTSASCLLVDQNTGHYVTRKPCMYDYDVTERGDETTRKCGELAIQTICKFAPPRHTTTSPTSTLAKLLAWQYEKPIREYELLCHQSDYLALHFMEPSSASRSSSSDWHNCLKLGYDLQLLRWPGWLYDCLESLNIPSKSVLPEVISPPGQPVGFISESTAKEFCLPTSTVIVGGTTDSNAAFFAATAGTVERRHDASGDEVQQQEGSLIMGTAVTSLGSTLAIKQLSSTYVEDAGVGVYSHRFPSVLMRNRGASDNADAAAWLVGGASNVGCAVLRQEGFSNDELDELSRHIDPLEESPLEYYPLTKQGERFPVADSAKQPVLEPKPAGRREYLHGILQGISTVEREGFLALGKLGATPRYPVHVWTAGGGSRNDVWTRMRQRRLRTAFGSNELRVERAENVEASYGAAILASASFTG